MRSSFEGLFRFVLKYSLRFLWLIIPVVLILVFSAIDNNRTVNIEIYVVPEVLKGDGFERAAVDIRITDTRGAPLKDHVLQIYVDGNGQVTRTRLKTDADGRASCEYVAYAVSRFAPAGVDTIKLDDTSVGKVIGVFKSVSAEVTVEDTARLSTEEIEDRMKGIKGGE